MVFPKLALWSEMQAAISYLHHPDLTASSGLYFCKNKVCGNTPSEETLQDIGEPSKSQITLRKSRERFDRRCEWPIDLGEGGHYRL